MYNDAKALTILKVAFEFLETKYGTSLYSEFFDVEGGYAFKSGQYTNDGTFVLRVTNIAPDGTIDRDANRKFINDPELINDLSNFVLKENDILTVMVGGSLGKVGIVPKKVLPALLNQNLWKIKYDRSFAPKYVFYLSLYLNHFKAIVKTSTHGHFSRKKYRDLQIPQITPKDSFEIAAYLDNVLTDGIIPDNDFFSECSFQIEKLLGKEKIVGIILMGLSDQLELVRRLRQALLREAMQGKLVPQDETDEPAEILLKRIKSSKAKPLPEINADEAPFEIPTSWTWLRLGHLGFWASGSGFPKSFQGRSDLPILFCKVSDMNLPENQKFILRTENTIDDKIAAKLRATPFQKGSIVFPKIGGAIATNKRRVIVRPTVIDNNCLGVSPSPVVDPDWVFQVMKSIDLKKYQSGTSVPSVSQGTIGMIPIALPPLAEQKRIVEKLEKLTAFCDELEANIRQSKHHAETLLQVALKEALEPNT